MHRLHLQNFMNMINSNLKLECVGRTFVTFCFFFLTCHKAITFVNLPVFLLIIFTIFLSKILHLLVLYQVLSVCGKLKCWLFQFNLFWNLECWNYFQYLNFFVRLILWTSLMWIYFVSVCSVWYVVLFQ